jgi:beta-N-acetylhexosaminidase
MGLSKLIGRLLVGGFQGTTLPQSYERALRAGERAGAILFRRNLTPELAGIAALTRAIAGACEAPIVAVDQEGGRVARLPRPALVVPPMREVYRRGGADLVARVARVQARELAALGFNVNFAPVLDVDTNPQSPIIGDRAFSSDPDDVAKAGCAYVGALQAEGIAACGKHFPGHGEAAKDSHLELPVVDKTRAELQKVELVPFAAAARARVASMMTAHVVYPALDALPATLSRAICTDLLRGELGFEGALFSDDLEMKAIQLDVEASAVRAVEAGCDLLLVCSDEALQDRAHAALVRRAERDGAFRARCDEAARRASALRRPIAPQEAPRLEPQDALVKELA